MALLTKISLIVGASAFAGIFVWGLIFQILLKIGVIRNPARLESYIKLGVFCLFFIFGLCCMPLMMRLFIAGQGTVGNSDVGMVRFLRENFAAVTYSFWGFLTLGALIALPVMWTDFFGFPKRASILPKSQGVLRANIGMTFDEVAKDSSLQLAAPSGSGLTGADKCVGQGVFDFEISGTRMRFDQCRYYFLETGANGEAHIRSMNIGISPLKTSKAETDARLELIHQRLQADRWRVGYFVYRTHVSQVLHGGISTERNDRFWSRDNTLLVISIRRMDDEVPGEDPATAGEFIVVLEISALDTSDHPNLQFDPPHELVPIIP